MVQTMEWPSPIRVILNARRKARYRSIIRNFRTFPGMRILDIGCGIDGRSFEDFCDPSWQIVGVDLEEPADVNHDHPNFSYVQADARDLSQFGDKSFDLVVSIGMLEHITELEAYYAVCREIQRVGRQYAVVVPFRWAWFEPHYAFPFFGALPRRVQIFLIRALNLSNHRNEIGYFLNNFEWRSISRYKADFPGSRVKILPTGETMAIIASSRQARTAA